MKLDIKWKKIQLLTETAQDLAYVEEILGLKNEGDKIILERVKNESGGFHALLETKEIKENRNEH